MITLSPGTGSRQRKAAPRKSARGLRCAARRGGAPKHAVTLVEGEPRRWVTILVLMTSSGCETTVRDAAEHRARDLRRQRHAHASAGAAESAAAPPPMVPPAPVAPLASAAAPPLVASGRWLMACEIRSHRKNWPAQYLVSRCIVIIPRVRACHAPKAQHPWPWPRPHTTRR